MSDTVKHTIMFASKEDKSNAFEFLLNSRKFTFIGVGIDTIVVKTDARDALAEQNIKFQEI